MQKKIFSSFFIILLFLLTSITITNMVILRQESKREALYSSKNSMQQTKAFLDYKVSSIRGFITVFSSNTTLQSILKTPSDTYQDNIGLWSLDTKTLMKVFYQSQSIPDISNIKLYMVQGPAGAYTNSYCLNIHNYEHAKWYQDYDFKSTSIQWYKSYQLTETSNPNEIIALKNIPDTNDLSKNIGIIQMEYSMDTLSNILKQTSRSASSEIFLLNKNGLLCSNEMAKCPVLDLQHYIQKKSISDFPYWNSDAYINHTHYLLGIDTIDKTDWQLVILTPHSALNKTALKSNQHIILVFGICFPIVLFFSFFITKSLTKRLRDLATQMHSIDTSTFYKDIIPSTKDEIGFLTQNYNYMLTKISMLLDERYHLGKEVKDAELQLLQSQINPHFLYNTLDQIYWMGIRYQVKDISDLVMELSKFYKLSLNNGKSIVTLKEEFDHIKAYINIQNIRFDHMISLNIECSDCFWPLAIPKLTLQPIVENAILHSICEKEETGLIQINVYKKQNILFIQISDDGIGMDEEMAQKLLLKNPQKNTKVSHGYSLYNINKRLLLLYGNEYGLLIHSKIGEGTSVFIKIPVDSSIDVKKI